MSDFKAIDRGVANEIRPHPESRSSAPVGRAQMKKIRRAPSSGSPTATACPKKKPPGRFMAGRSSRRSPTEDQGLRRAGRTFSKTFSAARGPWPAGRKAGRNFAVQNMGESDRSGTGARRARLAQPPMGACQGRTPLKNQTLGSYLAVIFFFFFLTNLPMRPPPAPFRGDGAAPALQIRSVRSPQK